MQQSRCTIGAVLCLVFLSMIVTSAPAFAHAALTKATPKDGAKLDAVPETVEIDYAEPPTTDTRFSVIDGCGNDVANNVDVLNQSITADVSTGQPGDWQVEWSVVSAVDGHLTKDGVAFTVDGDADCDQAAGEDVQTDDDSEGSSIPVIPIAVATAVILAIAVALRLRSN